MILLGHHVVLEVRLQRSFERLFWIARLLLEGQEANHLVHCQEFLPSLRIILYRYTQWVGTRQS